jgi:hypothetical protein
MIDKLGLYETIKLIGGYDNFIKKMDGYMLLLSNDDKIYFIREAIKDVTKKYNTIGISTDELSMNAIPYGPPDDELQQIEYFNPDFVTIDVYDGEDYERHKGNFKERYTDLDEDTLDNVFMFMVKASEKI